MVRNLGWAHELAAARRGSTALADGRRGCSGARQGGGRRANVDGRPGTGLEEVRSKQVVRKAAINLK